VTAPGVLRPWARPRLWLAGWLGMIATVIVASLLPSSSLPEPSFTGIDKVEHLLAYGLLSGYAVLLFATVRAHRVSAFALVALGVALEGAQAMLTTSRLADPGDMLANALGVALGWWLGRRVVVRWQSP